MFLRPIIREEVDIHIQALILYQQLKASELNEVPPAPKGKKR